MRLYFGLDGKTSFSRLETMKNQYILDTWYHPIPHKWHGEFKGIFLDSGAYSAWRQGKAIDREAYADYALSGGFAMTRGGPRCGCMAFDLFLVQELFRFGRWTPPVGHSQRGRSP